MHLILQHVKPKRKRKGGKKITKERERERAIPIYGQLNLFNKSKKRYLKIKTKVRKDNKK